MFKSLIPRLFFKLRYKVFNLNFSYRIYWRILGMKIGRRTRISKIYVSWPHQVAIGMDCLLEQHVYFHFDGMYRSGPSIFIGDRTFIGSGCEFNISNAASIGNDCLIASGCKFIDHDHSFTSRDIPINVQNNCAIGAITIANDVWLGVNVVVLKNVNIGKGVVVAAGSVVTKSIPSYEIWAGIPARKVAVRP